jgi:preprotein translocase subunit SecD
MGSLRNRLLIIAALVGLSAFSLLPRDRTIRERGLDGVMRDVTIRQVPLKLGLDLQGGIHLALELDQTRRVSADPARDIELALTVLRKRIDEFGVEEPIIQRVGDERIVVELAGITDPARAKQIVQRTAFLEFRITDKTGALERALPSIDRTLRSLGIRGTGTATAPSVVQQLLGDSAAHADTAETGPAVLADLIQPSPGTPGEYMVPESAYPRVDSLLFGVQEVRQVLPRGIVLRWAAQPVSIGVESYRMLYALEDRTIITGDRLEDAQAQLDPLTGGPIVLFQLDRQGGRQFGAQTARHVGDFMAIILDDLVQGRPPVIQSRIDRRGQITLSGRSLMEAQDLALTLKAGALPIPLRIVDERQVSASLGADAIRSGIIAGIIGTIFVVLVMVAYYRFAGVLAVLALSLYGLLVLGGLAAMGATLTLPGLAGLVLSVGMAVDANVLIFERIREELGAGKTIPLSVQEGFRNAMSAIIDSNVTTVLTALFLFRFGTGPVRGFAVTLIIGIIASMITAIFITRTFFMIWLERKQQLQTLSI